MQTVFITYGDKNFRQSKKNFQARPQDWDLTRFSDYIDMLHEGPGVLTFSLVGTGKHALSGKADMG